MSTAKIQADAVNGSKIANDSINTERYVNGSIDAANFASKPVTAAEIQGGAAATVGGLSTSHLRFSLVRATPTTFFN